ncbi:MAG: ABC transporter ATP-binding protein [Phycisphaerales bacterium]
MSTEIRIEAISKHYPPQGRFGSRTPTRAVDAIDLTIASGQLYFLLGPSGCGKTTLLRMIAGFIEPTDGRILFNGRDITALPAGKRNTGMVFQSYALWPHMTVADNVRFGLDIRKVGKPEAARRIDDALSAVRMNDYAGRKPNQLSGGQQQRVALARALVVRPDVLLLDEPLSNLDARLRIEMRSEIRRICSESGITTLYVTHDQKEALSMADQIAVLNNGRVVQVGAPKDLYARPINRFVAEFLGEATLLPGTFTPTPNAHGVIRTAVGDLNSAATDTPAGPAIAVVRPEAWRITPTDSGSGIRGRVREVRFMGELTEYLVDAGTPTKDSASPQTIQATALGVGIGLKPGDIVSMRADPGDVIIVPN